MARPLRIERSGGRYHITARGNERKGIFRDDPDRFHFLELLAELSPRFGCRVHATCSWKAGDIKSCDAMQRAFVVGRAV